MSGNSLLTQVILVIFCGFSSCQNPEQEEEGPRATTTNILLIFTDDQGIGDIGYNGNSFIHTPYLDSLAQAGIIFENFYTAPVCTPSRASLLTGKYSIRTGVFDTYNAGAIMDQDENTLAEILKIHGFATGIFGKWHLGDNYPSRPSEQGFDYSLIHKAGGIGQPGDADNYFRIDSSYFSPVLYENNQPIATKGYCSDVYTDALLKFIESNTNHPFFAFLSFNAPHTPLQLPQPYYDLYQNLDFQEADSNFLGETLTGQQLEEVKRVYGMVTNIDHNVGRVVSKLKELQILDRTIVVFLSDNGPQQSRYRMGLRGLKSTVYEGGIKVPAFWYQNGLRSKKINTVLSHIDLLPTFLDCLGLPSADSVDGISFKSLLEGNNKTEVFGNRPLFYHWQRGFPEAYRNIAVRRGDYKLVGHGASDMLDSGFELFNVKEDPHELNNINESHPEIVRDLKRQFDDWLKSMMKDPKLGYNRYIIGSESQRKTVLTRNDARGIPAMWVADHHMGLWDIEAERTGLYRLTVQFREKLPEPGRLLARLAPFQRTVEVQRGEQKILIEDYFLKSGPYTIECGFQDNSGAWTFPFTLSWEYIGP